MEYLLSSFESVVKAEWDEVVESEEPLELVLVVHTDEMDPDLYLRGVIEGVTFCI